MANNIQRAQPHGEGKNNRVRERNNTRLLEHRDQLAAAARPHGHAGVDGRADQQEDQQEPGVLVEQEHAQAQCQSHLHNVGDARPAFAQAHRHGQLARLNVGGDVTHVIRHEQRAGNQADADSTHPAEQGQRVRLRVEGAQGRDQTKVDEDEHIAQAHVAVGVLAAGVAPRREDAGGANRQEPPLVRQSHQGETGEHRQTEATEGGVLDGAGASYAGTDEAQRAHAVFVGALDAVGVVVGVVHADLQEECDEERQERVERLEFVDLVGGS